MYRLAVKDSLDKKFKKLQRKEKEILQRVNKKVQQALVDPYRFKPLKKPLQNKRRVHIGGSLVLIYEINEEEKLIILCDLDHHDNIYEI